MPSIYLTKVIRLSLCLLLAGFLVPLARAADPGADTTAAEMDAANRETLAGEVLELAYSPGSLRDSFEGYLTPALDAMKRDGMPDAAGAEMRVAFLAWFDQEVKWADIKPKLVQIYAHDFTSEELASFLHFLQDPVGQKVMAKLPLVMQEGALAGRDYFKGKQDSLNAKLAPIIEKYKGKSESPSATSAPSTP